MPIPMLTDEEWDEVRPLLQTDIQRIKSHREETGAGITEAINELRHAACERYFEITGFRETNPNALWHHYLSHFGFECPSCGYLLRTAKASFCANCGRHAGKLVIDWAAIVTLDQLYDVIFAQAGAPDWHGRNLNAINDAWVTGTICKQGPPFDFVILHEEQAAAELVAIAVMIREIATESVKENGGTISLEES